LLWRGALEREEITVCVNEECHYIRHCLRPWKHHTGSSSGNEFHDRFVWLSCTPRLLLEVPLIHQRASSPHRTNLYHRVVVNKQHVQRTIDRARCRVSRCFCWGS